MRVLDPRVMLAIGFVGFGAGTWIVTGLTKDWDFWELLLPQICRGVSLMLCMVTVNNIALGTLPPSRLKNASGLFNLTRNLGGAIGLALINTVLNDRMDLHLQRLHETVTWGSAAALERLDSLTRAAAGPWLRRRRRGAQGADEDGADGGAGHGLRRRVPDPDRRCSSRCPASRCS